MCSTKLRQQNNQNGQVFLEFILALVLLMTVSFAFSSGFQRLIGERWQIMIRIIAAPGGKDNVTIP